MLEKKNIAKQTLDKNSSTGGKKSSEEGPPAEVSFPVTVRDRWKTLTKTFEEEESALVH